MQKIRKILVLLLLGYVINGYGQDELVQQYHQIMNDFLSQPCLSFEMSNMQYADMNGDEVIEQIEFSVIKNGDVWYLESGDFETIFSKDFLVSIDNENRNIQLHEKSNLSPKKIFSNPSGVEKVFEYLKLAGALSEIGNGRQLMRFSAPASNQTSIELEYDAASGNVLRSTANIDMTQYEDLDHPFDGMRIEALYKSINTNVCAFNERTDEIVNSQFAVLINKKMYDNYSIN